MATRRRTLDYRIGALQSPVPPQKPEHAKEAYDLMAKRAAADGAKVRILSAALEKIVAQDPNRITEVGRIAREALALVESFS